MGEEPKTIKLFIAYSSGDEELFKELETHLKELKSTGHIHSWYERRITGEKWDQLISDKLEMSNIILMLISPNFLETNYFYESEVQRALDLHDEGKSELIPIILRETSLEDTSFTELETLPSYGKAIISPFWKDKDDAFKNVIHGIRKALRKIINPTEDIFIISREKAFPNCIKQFSINNFQCIKKMRVHVIPVDAQWVFITGENGDGKTALLQALAVGLMGNVDGSANHLLEDGKSRIEIEFKHASRNKIHRVYKQNGQWVRESVDKKEVLLENVLGYGVTRLNIMTKEAEETLREKQHPAYSLYHETEGNFKNIETWLKDMSSEKEEDDPPFVKNVKEILTGLMPNVTSLKIKGKEVYYNEKGFDARYAQISSGSKMIIAMIGDMIKRLYSLQPGVEKVSQLEAIVLIDELDLHLHPKWQKKLPGLLSKIFPKIQFWAATHSIVPFMEAPLNSVFITLTRTEEGTKAEKLDIDVKNLLPNTLISSPLFGIEDYIPPNADDFRTEYFYSDVLKNKDLHKKLEEVAKKFKLPKSFFDPHDTGDL